MGVAKLGNLSFRLDPSQIGWNYQLDTAIIDTIGGQVIQIVGATTGDISVVVMFGQDRANHQESWQLAENFASAMRTLIDNEMIPPGKATQKVNQPIPFSFNDGEHNWNFQVLIKAISDISGNGSIEHVVAKSSYGVQLTLFPVADSSTNLKRITTDAAVTRIAAGVGWSKTNSSQLKFNGSLTIQDAVNFIANASPNDPTFNGYLDSIFSGAGGATQ